MAIQQGLAGKSVGPVTPEIAREMVTPVIEKDGMGLFVDDPGAFYHGGRNEGFDSLLIGLRRAGVVVMINGNDDTGALARVARAALRQYK